MTASYTSFSVSVMTSSLRVLIVASCAPISRSFVISLGLSFSTECGMSSFNTDRVEALVEKGLNTERVGSLVREGVSTEHAVSWSGVGLSTERINTDRVETLERRGVSIGRAVSWVERVSLSVEGFRSEEGVTFRLCSCCDEGVLTLEG